MIFGNWLWPLRRRQLFSAAKSPWLRELENISVGHGVSLLCWRSGGLEHPHDTPPHLSRRHQLSSIAPSPLQTSQLSPECEVAHTPLKKCRAGLAWVRGDSQGIGDGSPRRTRHL